MYPNFLWALFLLLIPIAIHLFSFRRYKTVYFSRVEFLKEVKEDSRTGARLKHLLVLISRLLFLTLLVFAFAQPFTPIGDGETTENLTSIYFDNSLSMQSEGADGDLLNESKNAAIELITAFDENEKITILTSELLATDQRFVSKQEAIDRIKEIDFSPQSTKIQSAINVSRDLFERSVSPGNRRVILFSDLQKSIATDIATDSSDCTIYLYAAEAVDPGNIFIDSVWFESPIHRINNPVELFFRVRNISENDVEDMTINLQINEDSPRPKRISVAANSYSIDKITYTDRDAGIKEGTLSLQTDQLFFDDYYYFNYTIQENIPILILTEESGQNNVEQLYQSSNYYSAVSKNINAVTTDDFKDKSLIVCQNVNSIPSGIKDLLKNKLKSGATVILIPGTRADLSNWNSLSNEFNLPNLLPSEKTNSELTYFSDENPLFKGNFEEKPKGYKFSKVMEYYRLSGSSNNTYITLFGLTKTNPFLIYNKWNNGRVVLQSSPLNSDFTNFQNHALFGLTYLRLAETSSFQTPLHMTMGELENFPVNQEFTEENPMHLINEDYGVDVIPQMITSSQSRYITLSPVQEYIQEAGFYQLTNNKDFEQSISINYNRSESYTECFTVEDYQKLLNDGGFENVRILNNSDGERIELKKLNATEYWRILLILALVFLAIEILLIKLWKS